MGNKFTNVETYFIIIFLLVILVSAIIFLGEELIENDNANLDNDSLIYISNLSKTDLSEYQATRQEIEDPILVTGNTSQGNPKDQALDFLFGKGKGFPIEVAIKTIFSMPELIIVDLLRFNLNDWNWLISLFNWLYRFLVLIAVIYFARGIIRN